MKIAWVWLDSEHRFVRVEDLTPEEKLLRAVTATDYGPDIEQAWDECSRIPYQEIVKRRMLTQEHQGERPEDIEEDI